MAFGTSKDLAVWDVGRLVQYSVLGALLWVAYVVIYRLFLSPLAKFPGPKLAALTAAYEGYFECIKDGGGRYYLEIDRMHDKYGPIVRISPFEVHIRDPQWNDIYKLTRRTDKPIWYYRFFGTVGNMFSTANADLHRLRRRALEPYFSAAAVSRHVPVIEELRPHSRLGTPFGHLDSPDFEHGGNSAVRKFARLGFINRQLGGLVIPALKSIPPKIADLLKLGSPEVKGFYKNLAVVIKRELGTKAALSANAQDEAEENIIHQILTSKLPAEEKSAWRISFECSSVVLAGTETSGSLMSVISFLLLANPEKLSLLRTELEGEEMKRGRRPTVHELRELPYLTGVLTEGMRMHCGVSGRLPRIDPKQEITYKSWVIPRSTIISTTQNDTNFDPQIFPNPHEFLPERWLDDAERKRLDKYLFNFGRGTRSCIGKEVAYVELYLTIGRLYAPSSRLELQLYDTDYEHDVKLYHDYYGPFPMREHGIKVFVE